MSGDCIGNHICGVWSSHRCCVVQQDLTLRQMRHNIPHFGSVGSFVVLGHPKKINIGRFVRNLREARRNAGSSGKRDNPGVCVYISARK